jgi:hypothetical protein
MGEWLTDSEISKMLRRCGLLATEIPKVTVQFKTESGWPPGMQELSKRYPDLTFKMSMDAPNRIGQPFIMKCEIAGPADQIHRLATELEDSQTEEGATP